LPIRKSKILTIITINALRMNADEEIFDSNMNIPIETMVDKAIK